MSLGAAIGAITFTGSIIAFLKLRGIMSGSPITFIGQHYLNLSLGLILLGLIFYLCKTQADTWFWTIIVISFLVGVLLIIPNKFPCLEVSGDERPLRAKIKSTPEIR